MPDPTPAARAAGPAAVAEAFDRFWAVYPRRAGKGAARKAFGIAARKVSPEQLVAAAAAYAADPNQPDDETKIPHPATWLNQERWQDDPLPPKAGSRMRTAIVGNERRRAAVYGPPPADAQTELRRALQSAGGQAALPAATPRRDQP